MDKFTKNYVEKFMSELISRNPGESEFHQAVREVVESVADYVVAYPYLMDLKILERMVEPERVIMFRVPWTDDRGEIHINRGYRVQMNSAIGPPRAAPTSTPEADPTRKSCVSARVS